MDAGYGNDTELRAQITALELNYVAGIQASTTVWPPGMVPLPPLPGSGRGRPPKLLRRDPEHQPVAVKALAHTLPPAAWQDIAWREGSADWLSSRFARLRVRPAHRDSGAPSRTPKSGC
jgi:SRSO17 transposase